MDVFLLFFVLAGVITIVGALIGARRATAKQRHGNGTEPKPKTRTRDAANPRPELSLFDLVLELRDADTALHG
jgi:hypothetical protein